jgi:hypothetical protein
MKLFQKGPHHRSSRPLPYTFERGYARYRDTPNRLLDAPGGEPYQGGPFAHIEIEFVGGPDAPNVALDFRSRGTWWRENHFIPPAEPIRWTDSGPSRLNMRQNTFSWRRGAGNSSTANKFIFGHTMLPQPYAPTFNRGANKAYVMSQPHDNRVTVQRYRGQSYSQTTQVIN